MKRLMVISLTAIIFIGCSESTSTPAEPKPEKIKPSQTQINQVLTALKSENSDVVDAVYNEGGIYNWVLESMLLLMGKVHGWVMQWQCATHCMSMECLPKVTQHLKLLVMV